MVSGFTNLFTRELNSDHNSIVISLDRALVYGNLVAINEVIRANDKIKNFLTAWSRRPEYLLFEVVQYDEVEEKLLSG